MSVTESLTRTVSIDELFEHPENIRSVIDAEQIDELAQSIASVGLINPLTVVAGDDGRWLVVAGNRRLRALRLLAERQDPAFNGSVDVIVCDPEHAADSTATMLVENLQRVDLSALDEARGYARLVMKYNMSPKEMAATVGRSITHIQDRMSLLSLPDEVACHVGDGIPIGVAVQLAKITDETVRKEIFKEAKKGKIPDWRVDMALRTQRHHVEAAKLRELVEASGLTTFDSLKDAGRLYGEVEHLDSYTVDEYATYVPDPAHLLILSGPKLTVYEVLTDEARAERDRQRGVGLRLGEEWTPWHTWRSAMVEYEDEVDAWEQARTMAWGDFIKSLSRQDVQTYVLEIVAAEMVKPGPRFVSPHSIADVLGLFSDDDTKPSNPNELIKLYITDPVHAWQVFLVRSTLEYDESPSEKMQMLFDEHLVRIGLGVKPAMPAELEIEPWLGEDGVWVTDRPEPKPAPDEHLESDYESSVTGDVEDDFVDDDGDWDDDQGGFDDDFL